MIDGLSVSILDQLEPAGMVDASAGWQQRKSTQTRVALLEAALQCLAEFGYARTTTQRIAKRANISRGAMLHHYATKFDLIESVIDYACYKRMKQWVEAMGGLSEAERVEDQRGLDYLWSSLLSLEFQAFLELQVAARTDEELRRIFRPKAQRFDSVQYEVTAAVFPEWASDGEKLRLAVDFCQATMQGLVLNRDIFEPQARRVAVRELLRVALYAFRNNDLPLPPPTVLDSAPVLPSTTRTLRKTPQNPMGSSLDA